MLNYAQVYGTKALSTNSPAKPTIVSSGGCTNIPQRTRKLRNGGMSNYVLLAKNVRIEKQ